MHPTASSPQSPPVQAGTTHRLSSFTDGGGGGNPAGVWVGDRLPDPATMQRIAREVGYSETAFVAPAAGFERELRFFSAAAEVSFCGHATIAAGVMLGRTHGNGRYRMATAIGEVPVTVRSRDGQVEASLHSVPPRHETAPATLVDQALAALHWRRDELDPSIAPARAWAGAWHLVLATRTRARLAALAYDYDALRSLMLREGLTTLQLVWREHDGLFHSRNPFPVGDVVEDPATGAAAAALGGYLRDAGLISAPTHLVIRQGEDMQRRSLIRVEVPASGGIVVTGTATMIDAQSAP